MARAGKAAAGRGGGGGGGASAGAIRAGGAFVELFTKDTALQKGLNAASKKLKAWSESMVKAGAASLGAGLGILTPIVGTLASAVGRAEKIGDLVDVFGLSADAASRMASAFEIAGGSIEELETSLGKLALKNTQGKPLDEFLLDTAAALGEVDDASERFKQASDIFGAKFARKFIDTGSDVGGLFGQAPALTKQQLDDAKAVRMEWTRTTIVLQNATLPILNAVGPSLKFVAAALRENAGLIPSIAAIGAGLAAAGLALTTIGMAGMGVSAIISSVAALASPIGLATAAIVAGTAAWFAWSESGQEVIGRVSEAWGGIVAAMSSGNLEGALKVVTATMNVEWVKFNMSMKQSFGFSLDGMKELLIGWSYFVKDVWGDVTGFIAQALANAGEAAGILPAGTGATLESDRRREREARRAEAVAAAGKAATDHKARLAAAEAELKAAMAAAKAGGGVRPAAADIGPGRSIRQLGTSTSGAFNIGNAAQQFGGSSIAGQQLKQAEIQNAKLDGILSALRNVPLARL